MSLTSDELNYLIWRYAQEQGLELTALALQRESTVTQFDDKFGSSVPIGSLVNLVQKGILYAETDQLVAANGDVHEDKFYREKFTLLHALHADAAINPEIENKGRFRTANGDNKEDEDVDIDVDQRENSPEFVKVLTKKAGFEPSTTADWNPTAPSVLAFGLSDSRAKITVLTDGEPKQIQLSHPISFNTNTKDYSADITTVSWSPIGNQLLTAVETGELRLWSADGQLKNVLYSHHAPVVFIRWSPDSQYVLTSDADNSTILWNASTGVVLQNYDLRESTSTATSTTSGTEVTGMDATWIDDTKFIIPGLNGSALVFNITDRTPQGTLLGHTKHLTVLKFNKEDHLLLTASDDRTIRIWNGSNFNNSQILLGHTQSITYAEWITKDIVISTSIDSSIKVWDIRNAECLFTEVLDGIPIVQAQLSPDKTHTIVATAEGTLVLFSVDLLIQNKLKVEGEYEPEIPQDDIQNNIVTSLKWSSDSKNIVASYSHAQSVVIAI